MRILNKFQISILIFLFITIFAGGMIRLFLARKGNTQFNNSEFLKNNKSENSNIYVHIRGEVRLPGIYKVKENTRLYELIRKAGGCTKNADLGEINLASIVKDGEKITIPPIEEKISETSLNSQNTASIKNKVNINTADVNELDSLPGIGPAIAKRIVEYRKDNGSFKELEELKLVKGIGNKNFKKIKDLITVE